MSPQSAVDMTSQHPAPAPQSRDMAVRTRLSTTTHGHAGAGLPPKLGALSCPGTGITAETTTACPGPDGKAQRPAGRGLRTPSNGHSPSEVGVPRTRRGKQGRSLVSDNAPGLVPKPAPLLACTPVLRPRPSRWHSRRTVLQRGGSTGAPGRFRRPLGHPCVGPLTPRVAHLTNIPARGAISRVA